MTYVKFESSREVSVNCKAQFFCIKCPENSEHEFIAMESVNHEYGFFNIKWYNHCVNSVRVEAKVYPQY